MRRKLPGKPKATVFKNSIGVSNLSLRSGLVYNDLGFKTREEDLHWQDSPTTGNAYIVTRYRYIHIPLDVHYTFHHRRRTSWFVAGGISPAIFIQRTNILHYNTGAGWHKSKDNEGIGYDRINWLANLQAGMEYTLSRKFALQASLFYKQLIKATNSNIVSKEVLYATGAAVTVLYKR